ncbi:transposase [Mucilaginibacter flavus]|uniref:transposase n=1 Tax=Mucilaginibacter flavus TaxID=931504 RepID=UPI0025B3E23C|nr:transposase [Mucilaginibacter flavus]MDN3583800.1 transposase [Mucilaginibacter flavus]
MKAYNVILGVDVSKRTLDIGCADRLQHIQIENSSKGFNVLKKWCKSHEIDLSASLIILEYTGGYEYRFLQFCTAHQIDFCRISGLEIKRSMGMTRGKNDKVDSFRIGQYGEEKIKRLELSKPLNDNILKLKQLLSFRKRLVREKAGLTATVKEREYMYEVSKKDTVVRIGTRKIKQDEQYIQEIEAEIMALIKADILMHQNYRILTSIKGIGPINAWMTLAYTENFTSFENARQYAVFAGVIPFEHKSGTSIKGKNRVSHMANKELKQELNQAAKTAMIHDPEIHAYAERLLKTKAYSLVLNNIKFKLILRMFSLVKRGEMYVENYRRIA